MSSFQRELFYEQLQTSRIGKKLVYNEVTGSTMDDARRLAHDVADHPHGTVVMSERQTNARGARDHKWDASNLGNIYVSLILHVSANYKTFEGKFCLEVAACLAVLKAIHALGVTNAIPKWPNDIWIKGHKLAGFLAEDGKLDISGSTKCLLILGMGINVNANVRHSAEMQSIATSLFCEKGGTNINRETFFAQVCNELEDILAQCREVNFKSFTVQNLFKRDCAISVTCPSLTKVFDATFLEICDNWEVKFIDKRTEEVLQGRSDFYTIRPKVFRKILVVFTGIQGNASANLLASWLMSLVDTSQYVVCLVPENSITRSVDWMKTCSLLIFVERPCDLDSLTTRLKSYLGSGGRVMASGMASQFVASYIDVPVKEALLESSYVNTELGLVHLQLDMIRTSDASLQETLSLPSGDSMTLVFPTKPVCFQFFNNKEFHPSSISSGQGDNSEVLKSIDMEHNSKATPGCTHSSNIKVFAHYIGVTDTSTAVFTSCTDQNGMVALWGFDIGVVYPGTKEVFGSGGKGCVDREMMELEGDRFGRDDLLLRVLAEVLKYRG